MVIAGTGHRPEKLGGYTNDAFLKLVKIATEWLKENKPDKVISGMAMGWDQALALASVRLNIPLICAIPFKGQERQWSSSVQKFYNKLLDKASEVVYVSPSGYSSKKMQIRNEWMVDNCNVILAMWDGSPGGTGNCIKYAKSKNKKIINLYEH